MSKKAVAALILLALIPAAILLGVTLLRDRSYNLISVAVALLACVPFFAAFERSRASGRRLVILAVLAALSVVGRLAFFAVPGFKPITAVVVIAAIYFGPEAGFMLGAFSAVLSNIFFGQGPWTPFQMFTFGLAGFAAGLLAGRLLRSRVLLCLYGVAAGVAFSMLMDVWSAINIDGYFNIRRWLAFLLTSLPFMAIYAVSNVAFLLLLTRPIGERLERIKLKYGL
jgi:uncharacterized membrane protein